MKVLFLFKNPRVDNPDAHHEGLGVTACLSARFLRGAGVCAESLPVPNGEYIWEQLSGPWSDATHVVLEAPFIDAPFLGRMFRAFPGKRFSLVYHSNLGFLAQDGFAGASMPLYATLARNFTNFTLGGNSAELADAMERGAGVPFAWLPNLYQLPALVGRESWNELRLEVGLFGAARVLKNWLTAGAASMIIAGELGVQVRLHVNTERNEGAAATRRNLAALVTMNPRVSIVEVPWMRHDVFVDYLRGIDLCLQPSFTETFNMVTADGIAAGAPSVVSSAISWAPREWNAQPDSACDVARVGCAMVREGLAAHVCLGRAALEAHNRSALEAWKSWLRL